MSHSSLSHRVRCCLKTNKQTNKKQKNPVIVPTAHPTATKVYSTNYFSILSWTVNSFTTQTKQARYDGSKLLESPLSHMAIWRPAWATWEAILSKPKDNNSKTKQLTKTKTDWDLLWGSRIGEESLRGRLGVRPCSSKKTTTKSTKPSLSCILFALCVHHIDSQTHLLPLKKEILFPETPRHLPPLNIYVTSCPWTFMACIFSLLTHLFIETGLTVLSS